MSNIWKFLPYNENFYTAKNLLDLIRLDEMANAIQKYTGITGTVFFSTKDSLKNQQAHALGRVKLLRNGESVSISTKKGTNGIRKILGSNQKMIRDLEKFVDLNEKILWKYWNTNLHEADAVETIRSLKKVK